MSGGMGRLLFLGIVTTIMYCVVSMSNHEATRLDIGIVLLLTAAALWTFVYHTGSDVIDARFDFGATLKPDPKAFFKKAVEVVRSNTLYHDRLIDWQYWSTRHEEIVDFSQAVELLNSFLKNLPDKYAFFMSAPQIKNYYAKQKGGGVAVSRMLADGVGHLHLKHFMSAKTAKEFARAMRSLSGARAIILDLRDNPGGLLSQCNLVLSMLLSEGKLVEVRGHRDGSDFQQNYTLTKNAIVANPRFPEDNEVRYPDYLRGRPLVILINSGTASASEIVAGILQGNGTAKLVGEKSYGKGIAQRINTLDYGAGLYCTFASVHLQSGACVQGDGLQPDYCCSSEMQLETASKLLAAELPQKLVC